MAITYEPIATTTLGSTANNITFNSIPATYTDLIIVVTASVSSGNDTFSMRFNNDTGSNYSFTTLNGNGASATSTIRNARTAIDFDDITSMAAGNLSFFTSDIFSYAGSTYKTVLNTASQDRNGSGSIEKSIGLWSATAAINTIKLFTYASVSMPIGTTATLYGIKAA